MFSAGFGGCFGDLPGTCLGGFSGYSGRLVSRIFSISLKAQGPM